MFAGSTGSPSVRQRRVGHSGPPTGNFQLFSDGDPNTSGDDDSSDEDYESDGDDANETDYSNSDSD